MDSLPTNKLKELAAVWNLLADGVSNPPFHQEFGTTLAMLDQREKDFPEQSPGTLAMLLEMKAFCALHQRFSVMEIQRACALVTGRSRRRADAAHHQKKQLLAGPN